MRFTPTTLKALKPRERLYIKREGDVFSVIVYPASKKSPKGTKVWYYIYNLGGKNKKIRIGEYPAWSIAEAREKAAARLRGENVTSSNLETTINDLADRYVEQHSKKKSTEKVYRENKRNLAVDILPSIGIIKIQDIKRADIYDLLEKITKREAPVQANNALKVVRKMLNYGIQAGMVEANPAHLIERNPEREKTRVLSTAEINDFLLGKIPGKLSRHTLRCLRNILITAPLFAAEYVQGYSRGDGTYVQGHYRSSPDSNYNPYTGNTGQYDSSTSSNPYFYNPTNSRDE